MFRNRMPRYEVLSEDAMAKLDAAWRRLVTEVGVEFMDDRAAKRSTDHSSERLDKRRVQRRSPQHQWTSDLCLRRDRYDGALGLVARHHSLLVMLAARTVHRKTRRLRDARIELVHGSRSRTRCEAERTSRGLQPAHSPAVLE